MALTKEEVLHIATLCRIALSLEEVGQLREELSHILEQFQVLKELNTDDVEPIMHLANLNTVMRDDEVAPCLKKELILANAPRLEGDFFMVKVVLEE